jgi:hypothetical protein
MTRKPRFGLWNATSSALLSDSRIPLGFASCRSARDQVHGLIRLFAWTPLGSTVAVVWVDSECAGVAP